MSDVDTDSEAKIKLTVTKEWLTLSEKFFSLQLEEDLSRYQKKKYKERLISAYIWKVKQSDKNFVLYFRGDVGRIQFKRGHLSEVIRLIKDEESEPAKSNRKKLCKLDEL